MQKSSLSLSNSGEVEHVIPRVSSLFDFDKLEPLPSQDLPSQGSTTADAPPIIRPPTRRPPSTDDPPADVLTTTRQMEAAEHEAVLLAIREKDEAEVRQRRRRNRIYGAGFACLATLGTGLLVVAIDAVLDLVDGQAEIVNELAPATEPVSLDDSFEAEVIFGDDDERVASPTATTVGGQVSASDRSASQSPLPTRSSIDAVPANAVSGNNPSGGGRPVPPILVGPQAGPSPVNPIPITPTPLNPTPVNPAPTSAESTTTTRASESTTTTAASQPEPTDPAPPTT